MKRIFHPDNFTTVPDGTEVSAFINPTDSVTGSWVEHLPESVSVAAGRIAPETLSWIHVLPLVTQITYVVAGNLTARMSKPGEDEPYALEVPAGAAIVTEPGTLLQLGNETEEPLAVLYIVSPSYVFETDAEDRVVYDDAILMAEDWKSLSHDDPDGYAIEDVRARRADARARLAGARRADA
ncbi:MAG: hypothetical protein OES38_12710 [Gammaproteobacteria bacterium]|nr:hypothetical protein [Gammaproteobacteria bacterium]